MRSLDCTGRVVVVEVAVVAGVVVEGTLPDIVSCLATLEAGAPPFCVTRNGALVVKSFTGISPLLGLILSDLGVWGRVAGLPGTGLGRSPFLVVLAGLKLSLVGVVNSTVLLL